MFGHQICVFTIRYVAGTDLAGHCDAQIKKRVPVFLFWTQMCSPIQKAFIQQGGPWPSMQFCRGTGSQLALCVYGRLGFSRELHSVVGCGAQHMLFLHPLAHLWICIFLFAVGGLTSPSFKYSRCLIAAFGWARVKGQSHFAPTPLLWAGLPRASLKTQHPL